MKLLLFHSLWGMSGSLSEQLTRIAEAGYDGIECAPTFPKNELLPLLRDLKLQYVANIYPATGEQFRESLQTAAEYAPLKVISQSGRDSMSRDEGCEFFEQALAAEAASGIEVAHETHRGKLCATPWETAYYLSEFTDLKINADYSHWVVVCERLPDDRADDFALAAERAIHIHGRVGYEEGPQVPDPAAPEYARQLAWHEAQWKAICRAQVRVGRQTLAFTPEYGPPDYLHTLPYTRVPVADLWQVCNWQAQHFRELWAREVLGQ